MYVHIHAAVHYLSRGNIAIFKKYFLPLGLNISLAGSGLTPCSGRVEIFHNNTWRTACHTSWSLHYAEVVCRELQCGKALSAPHSVNFGPATGQTLFVGVNCSGSECSLTVSNSTQSCGREKEAGVICSSKKYF